jgi:hypothetical protein
MKSAQHPKTTSGQMLTKMQEGMNKSFNIHAAFA